MTTSRLFWLAVLILAVYILYLLSPVLTPFLIATIIAYLGDPLVRKLESWGMTRIWAVISVFSAFFLIIAMVILVLIPALNSQINNIINNLPKYLNWFQAHVLSNFPSIFGGNGSEIDAQNIQKLIQSHIGNMGDVLNKVLGKIKGPLSTITNAITYIFLIPVVAFYMLRDWNKIIAAFVSLIPLAYKGTTLDLARKSDEVLGGFLRGQLIVMLGLGTIYSIGLTILGLDMAIAIGMFAGLVSFVPYLGLIVGITIAGVMSVVQFHDWLHLLGVVITFVVAQTIESTVLTPKFVGDRIGLHPVAVLFSVLTGGQLFGFMGILLALPVASVINVFLIFLKENYLSSNIYQTAPKEKLNLFERQGIEHENDTKH